MTWTPDNTRQKGFTIFHMNRQLKSSKAQQQYSFTFWGKKPKNSKAGQQYHVHTFVHNLVSFQ